MLQPLFLTNFFGLVFLLFLILVMMIYLGFRIIVVRENTEVVVERLGQYHETWMPGMHFLYPFIDRIRRFYDMNGKVCSIIDMKEIEITSSPKELFTRDNHSIKINISYFLKIADAKLFIYASENSWAMVYSLISKSLYNIISEMTMSEINEGRNRIRKELTSALSEPLQSWGFQLNHVEIGAISVQNNNVN